MRVALADNASQYGFMINNDVEGASFFNKLIRTDLGDLLEGATQKMKVKIREFDCSLLETKGTKEEFLPIEQFDRINHEKVISR